MKYKSVLVWSLACASVVTNEIPARELTLIGNHPTSVLTGYPAIHTMKAHAGRIFMGYGEWWYAATFPPVVIVSYDPSEHAFHLEYSAGTDSIGIFREIGGVLYVPSTDPGLQTGFRDYIFRTNGVWRDRTPAGMFHVLDIGTADGSDLWIVGSKSINETAPYNAAVFRSVDCGRNWTDLSVQSAEVRYYWGFGLGGRWYVSDTMYAGPTSTRTVAAPYLHVNKGTRMGSGSSEFVVAVTGWLKGSGLALARPLVTYDTQTWRTLLNSVVIDFTVVGSNVYTLQTNPPVNRIWVSSNLTAAQASWQPLDFTNVPPNAKSIEVLDNVVYVGDTAGRLWAGRLDGGTINTNPPAIVNELSDDFGAALSFDDDTLAVGAPDHSTNAPLSGQVTIWEPAANGGGAWRRSSIINPPTPSFSGWFGKAVALKDNVLAVVEAGRDLSRVYRGATAQVHLYQRNGQNWNWRASLNRGQAFSVALDSEWLAVGGTNSLGLYHIRREPTLQVTPATNILIAASYFNDWQGIPQVCLKDDLCVFALGGDIGEGGGPGQAFVFQWDSAGLWQLQQQLSAPSVPPPGLLFPPDRFGASVAMAGRWLSIGAPRDDTSALQAGAVHLYERTGTTGGPPAFVHRQTIYSPLAQPEAAFGSAVALKGTTLLVGCPGAERDGENQRGAVYVFRLETNTWRNVAEVYRGPGSLGEFGNTVAFGAGWLAASSRFTTVSSNVTDRLAVWPFGPTGGELVSVLPQGGGGMQIHARGELGATYYLQATTNVPGGWSDLFTFKLTTARTNYTDASVAEPRKIYRLSSEPRSSVP